MLNDEHSTALNILGMYFIIMLLLLLKITFKNQFWPFMKFLFSEQNQMSE